VIACFLTACVTGLGAIALVLMFMSDIQEHRRLNREIREGGERDV
tara:strand:- start:3364 stop:3498 length:135 start_codon:yes stop_codon:yes gene_type:complete